MPANRPRKHHYVQQAHLKLFADSDGLCLIRTKDKREFKTHPKNAFAIRDLYAIDAGGIDPSVFEKALGDVETETFPAVEKISRNLEIEPRDKELVIAYLATSYLRNPVFQSSVKSNLTEVVKATARGLENTGALKAFEGEGPFSGKQFSELVQREMVEIEIANWKFIEAFQESFELVLKLLEQFELNVVVSNDCEIIVGDHPLTFIHPGRDLAGYGIPLGGEGCEITFPVSKKASLIGAWNKPIARRSDRAAINAVNRRQAVFSNNALCGTQGQNLEELIDEFSNMNFGQQNETMPSLDGSFLISRRLILPPREGRRFIINETPLA